MTRQALRYATAAQAVLQRIVDTQMEQIERAAQIITQALANDGILYTFGTGHSHVIAEDVAYRAGGLAPVDAILEPSLTGHAKVWQSEYMERVQGMADVILNYYGISSKDVLVVISNSGRNAAPIEMAAGARERGVPVIAITSLAHSKGTTSRHSSGKKLYQLANVVIDNCCPRGDCLLHVDGLAAPIGAGSGVTGLFIIHSVIVQTIQNLLDRGIDPPVFRSGNLDGSDEFNQALLERYKGRIKIW
ncbi:MAG: SIS domain-containing protein [Anaerolineales bacterium]|nr:MAG: SIS domain-containing protein [Anaerolineales bacterium]